MEIFKALIADDEPKIRRGLKNSFNWSELNKTVVGEAEDGEIALQIAEEKLSDIMLVDICKPFINDLELINCVKKLLSGCITVVVSGHDEFEYAQQAIKLNIFDYLLKPISRIQLHEVMEKAKEALVKAHLHNKYMMWAEHQMKKNLPYLKERFFNERVEGHLTDIEIEEQLEFFGQEISLHSGMLAVKLTDIQINGEVVKELERQLKLMAVQNILKELLKEWTPHAVFRDNLDEIISITPSKQVPEWSQLGEKLCQLWRRTFNRLL